MRLSSSLVLILALGLAPAAPARAQSATELHEQAVASLRSELRGLDADPSLADLAGLERLQARQAIEEAQLAKRRDRENGLAVARLRLQAARTAAEAELLDEQSRQLDIVRVQIIVESCRLEG